MVLLHNNGIYVHYFISVRVILFKFIYISNKILHFSSVDERKKHVHDTGYLNNISYNP